MLDNKHTITVESRITDTSVVDGFPRFEFYDRSNNVLLVVVEQCGEKSFRVQVDQKIEVLLFNQSDSIAPSMQTKRNDDLRCQEVQ